MMRLYCGTLFSQYTEEMKKDVALAITNLENTYKQIEDEILACLAAASQFSTTTAAMYQDPNSPFFKLEILAKKKVAILRELAECNIDVFRCTGSIDALRNAKDYFEQASNFLKKNAEPVPFMLGCSITMLDEQITYLEKPEGMQYLVQVAACLNRHIAAPFRKSRLLDEENLEMELSRKLPL